jgi:hypothetical protein
MWVLSTRDKFQGRGVHFVDSPVSGGPAHAKLGDLTMGGRVISFLLLSSCSSIQNNQNSGGTANRITWEEDHQLGHVEWKEPATGLM